MARYAALIAPLVISGSCKSNGDPNAGGSAYFYLPETTSPTTVYADAEATIPVAQPVVLDNGGKVNASDYAGGIFATSPVRLYVQDSDGALVSDSTFIPASAGNTGLSNDGFTGDDVDDMATAALASFGGQDFKTKTSSGEVERYLKDELKDIWINVKRFGAVGNGIAIDTTAIQNAVNFAISLGGGVVYLPPGTYKIDQTIALTSPVGVRVSGAGRRASVITQTNAAGDVFSVSSGTDFSVSQLGINHATATTGAAVRLVSCLRPGVVDVTVTSGDYAYGISASGALSSDLYVSSSFIGGTTAAISVADVSVSAILNSTLTAPAATGISFSGASSSGYIGNVNFLSVMTNGILFDSAMTGSGFTVIACPTLGDQTNPINQTGIATDRVSRQIANRVDGYTTSQASGGGGGSSFTPDRSRGREFHVRLTSGGAAVLTIAAPTPALPATATGRDHRITFRITGAAGGAITARFNAVFVIVGGGTDIAVADGTTETVVFEWDIQTSKWREDYRSATAT